MLETFYEQIKEFGVLVTATNSHNYEVSKSRIETYIVLGTQLDVYLTDGKPKTIIVSQ